MLSAVAWATAPPPAHHVARGALPRLPPPAAVGRRGRGRQLPAPGAGGAGGLAPFASPCPDLTMPAGLTVPPVSAVPMPQGSIPAPPHGRSPLPALGAAGAPPQTPSRQSPAAVAAL